MSGLGFAIILRAMPFNLAQFHTNYTGAESVVSVSLNDFLPVLQREFKKAGLPHFSKEILFSINKKKAHILNELLEYGEFLTQAALPVDHYVLIDYVTVSPEGAKFWPGSGKAHYSVVVSDKPYHNAFRKKPSDFEGRPASSLADFLDVNADLHRTRESIGGIPAGSSTEWRGWVIKEMKKAQSGIIRRTLNA